MKYQWVHKLQWELRLQGAQGHRPRLPSYIRHRSLRYFEGVRGNEIKPCDFCVHTTRAEFQELPTLLSSVPRDRWASSLGIRSSSQAGVLQGTPKGRAGLVLRPGVGVQKGWERSTKISRTLNERNCLAISGPQPRLKFYLMPQGHFSW